MNASESEIHPFCSVEDWYSFGKHKRHSRVWGMSSSEAMGEMIKMLHLKELCWKTKTYSQLCVVLVSVEH